MERVKTNMKIDDVQTWLDNVAFSHSGCKSTEVNYRIWFKKFCDFIGRSAAEILAEYEESTDRDFKRKYARYVKGWISTLQREGYANKTITVHVTSVQSFFKYSDLPLGHIPKGRAYVTFHNRDITKQEISHVLSISRIREKAFYTVMAQSGLRPQTVCNLRIKHVEKILDDETPIPCKIDVPRELAKGKYRGYFTFIGEEAVRHLKNYLRYRRNLTPQSYLFTQLYSDESTEYSTYSHRFRNSLLTLRQKGIIEFEQKKIGKPSELRLYNLRKFFRKFANQAGFEYVQFWMGHIVTAGQEENYRPRDPEHHRQIYAEKAMPFLKIEDIAPLETLGIILQQSEEIETLKQELADLKKQFALIIKSGAVYFATKDRPREQPNQEVLEQSKKTLKRVKEKEREKAAP